MIEIILFALFLPVVVYLFIATDSAWNIIIVLIGIGLCTGFLS
jgi:hypothetical protein